MRSEDSVIILIGNTYKCKACEKKCLLWNLSRETPKFCPFDGGLVPWELIKNNEV